jgi:hypothetical protein
MTIIGHRPDPTPAPGHPYSLGPGEGPALWHLGGLITFKATRACPANR